MSKVLLDTHAFLWAIADESRLGPLSRELILSGADVVLLSYVSFSAYGGLLQDARR